MELWHIWPNRTTWKEDLSLACIALFAMDDCTLKKATVIFKLLIIIVYNYSINLTLAEIINALSSFRVYVNTANPEFLFFFTFTSLYMI